MGDLSKYFDETGFTIEGAGYEIESKSLADGDNTFNISYNDTKHITKYSFVAELNDKTEVHIKITAAFLSGIEEDFTRIIDGRLGPINISNAGRPMECKIQYKLKAAFDQYGNLDIRGLLSEVEDSIYRVKYRKSFAL